MKLSNSQYQQMMQKAQIIGHGAQAKCFKVFNQNDQTYFVVKHRLPKKYRHPKLDQRINTARVKSEAKILNKVLSKGIKAPKVLQVLPQGNKIVMEFLEGKKLKDYINQNTPQQAQNIIKKLANIIHKLHGCNIIHGDLTTSNMIENQGQLYLIDFGLGALTATVEDKAVDLYLFQRAFIATHPHLDNMFSKFLQAYGDKAVLVRLQQVRQRGRKKVAFG